MNSTPLYKCLSLPSRGRNSAMTEARSAGKRRVSLPLVEHQPVGLLCGGAGNPRALPLLGSGAFCPCAAAE